MDAVILASGSPRRAELLTAAGIPFETQPADVDETVVAGEAPEAYVQRLAEAKAHAVAHRHPGRLIVAADTTVVVDGEIFGKPADHADAIRMLRALSGRSHVVLTGICVVGPGRQASAVDRTRVVFATMSDGEIAAYVRSGEPMDKAGAYAIQGLASRYVTRIEGSYSNVVGLPVAMVHQLLEQARTPRA